MSNAVTESDKVQKRWVWIPCPKELYKPAYIVEESNASVKVQADALETHKSAEVFKMNPMKFDRVEDLGCLSHLNEPSVLHNIQMRYNDSCMYTYSGLFLLALNPYRSMNIYNDGVKKKVMMEKMREGSPHVFSVANEAYRSMIANKANQSILITGESGAGKTENTKKVIEFLAFAAGGKGRDEGHEGVAWNIEDALMSANPILEAFGNAKTIKNDNSSRFGKFIQVKFRGGRICGAKIEKYLLEKSRVTSSSSGERNFHIFYYLLAGASEELLGRLSLRGDPSKYGCLRDTQHRIPNVDDSAEFGHLNSAFRELGIEDPVYYYRLVAVILHLSNVEFAEQNDRAIIKETKEGYNPFEVVCALLGISLTDFLNAIIHPVMKAGNEYVVHYRTKEQVLSIIEGLMKMLYESLFDDLILCINRRLDSMCDSYIGILDIAGFEIFTTNSFEQLCINYTNEKLQQYFNHHMFILEQEIYRNEEIDWDFIDFGLDLEPTIRTIESSNPIGILSYLDEECVMPCASDETLLEKLQKVQMVERVSFKNNFRIKHYAGKVEYEVRNWLRKNKDTESEALLQLIIENRADPRSKTDEARGDSKFVKKGAFKTVSQSHKEGLRWLMDTLKETQPHFIRCIIPNLQKSPEVFNKRLVLDQLRCNGVLEGIRISRLGYPTRLPFADFNSRYHCLVESDRGDDPIAKNKTVEIIEHLKLNRNSYRIGRTMVFFRQGIIADLEEHREKKIQHIAEAIQTLLRAKVAVRKQSLEHDRMDAVVCIQRNAALALNILSWKWWSLFLKVQPLLDVKRAENNKKALEDQISGYMSVIDQGKEALASKEREIVELGILMAGLEASISKKDSEIQDKEGLLESLRQENTRILSFLQDIKDKEEMIISLRESMEQSFIKEANHSREHERLLSQLAELGSQLKKKEGELDMMIEQDLGNVLQSKESELKAARAAVSELEGENTRLGLENGKIREAFEQKSEDYEKLHEIADQRSSELISEQARSEKELLALNKQLESDSGMISKLKEELADLQLENDSLSSKSVQMEYTIQANENALKSLSQDLNYQKIRNSSLEASIQTLKSIKSIDKETERPEAAAENDDNVVLNKTINSLKSKLAYEQKMNAKLTEEKDGLYNENLKLMQSKLDDLFSTESEFNAARSAMQTEIRRLEGENHLLKKELLAAQSMSDYSDDFGIEKISLLLEEEKKQRKTLDVRIIELENTNLKLENQIKNLSGEIAQLEKQSVENRGASVARSELSGLKRELSHTKKCLNTISETFQREFFDILSRKEDYYQKLAARQNETLSDLNMKASQLEELKRGHGALASSFDELKKRYNQSCNEHEALIVDNKANVATIKELRQHVSKIEETYNEREAAIGEMKSRYIQVCEDLNSRREQYMESVRQLKEQIVSRNHREFSEALQTARKTSNEKIAQLVRENDELRSQNEETSTRLYSLEAENAELRSFAESIGRSDEALEQRPEDPNALFVAERLVSTFVVDKDALKASEWKNIVAEKCPRCAEIKKEVVSSDGAEVAQLNNEISLLRLRLRQAERVMEEDKKIIEAMKACMVVHRKSRPTEN